MLRVPFAGVRLAAQAVTHVAALRASLPHSTNPCACWSTLPTACTRPLMEAAVPGALALSAHAFDAAFALRGAECRHLLAVALITGKVELYQLEGPGSPPIGAEAAGNGPQYVSKAAHRVHAKSCRQVRFLEAGPHANRLLTGGADNNCLISTLDGRECWRGTHTAPVNAVAPASAAGELVASGDDEGFIKVWDVRSNAGPAVTFRDDEDYVSGIVAGHPRHPDFLVATVGEYLCVYDRRKGKLFARSDEHECDLLNCAIVKNGDKVVCGASLKGGVFVFDWGDFGFREDCIAGGAGEVNCLEVIADEEPSLFLTGSSDGLVRLVGACPSVVYGVVGCVAEDAEEGSEVTVLRVNSDHSFIVAGNGAEPFTFFPTAPITAMYERLADNPREGHETTREARGATAAALHNAEFFDDI